MKYKPVKDCHYYYNCCDCGGNQCGCRYCFACHACERCLNDDADNCELIGTEHEY